MTNQTSPKRFRRGDTSPKHAGLVFIRYDSATGKEIWRSLVFLNNLRQKAAVQLSMYRKTKTHKRWYAGYITKNKGRIREQERDYRQRNRDKINARQRKTYKPWRD